MNKSIILYLIFLQKIPYSYSRCSLLKIPRFLRDGQGLKSMRGQGGGRGGHTVRMTFPLVSPPRGHPVEDLGDLPKLPLPGVRKSQIQSDTQIHSSDTVRYKTYSRGCLNTPAREVSYTKAHKEGGESLLLGCLNTPARECLYPY